MVLSTAKNLLLIGGGHSHALVLHYWRSLPGVDLTLISENSTTPYSGMVPGYIAGFYDREECFIDLEELCHRSGAHFIKDRVTALDLDSQTVRITDRSLSFDLVSLDIGSSPLVPDSVSSPWVIPVKPIGQFLARWEEIRQIHRPLTIAIVGGGAGGVELAFAIASKLQNSQIHLIHQGKNLLPSHNDWVQQKALQKLEARGIKVHLNNAVVQVKDQILSSHTGFHLTCDFVLWVTQARGASWLRSSGLTLDDRDFILVNNCLRSVSHPFVFASGDIASLVNCPLPKAGVFAVRQGLPLYRNLRRSLHNQSLVPFRPPVNYLSLIGTGDGRAIASWGRWGAEGRWLWHVKNYIDRRFMAKLGRHIRQAIASPF